MGGFAGIPGMQSALQQPDDIDQAAQGGPQKIAQLLQQSQQGAPQGQPAPQQGQQQQGQQPDQIEQLKQSLAQQATPQQGPSGGPIKRFLQNFIGGMGQSMVHEAGLPTEYDKQQKAMTNLSLLTSSQGLASLHQSMAAQYAPVPLVGLDSKPITDPTTGKVISLPANHAQTFYAGQVAAANRLQVQGMKGDTATQVQSMKDQSAQATHPLQSVLNDASQAYTSGDMDTYRSKLAEATQMGAAPTATSQQNKLDMFRQSQAYQQWKTTQDNQTKLQVAQMSAGKAPAAMMQTAAFAQSGLNRLDDAQAAMQRLEARGVLGNVASNKIENWIFGNGLVDPTLPAQDKEDIGKLRAAASYTSSAAMRAHTGRTSREIYDDFKNTMGINQGPDAWRGAMQETRSMLNDYATGATNAAVQKLRGGANPPPSTPPTTGGFAAWKARQNAR
jgi:hypothetical protein